MLRLNYFRNGMRMTGTKIGAFSRNPRGAQPQMVARSLACSSHNHNQTQRASVTNFSIRSNPLDLRNETLIPATIKTDFVGQVIQCLDGDNPYNKLKEMFDSQSCKVFDLVQVPEAYWMLRHYHSAQIMYPNGSHRHIHLDVGVEEIENILNLLVTHPKTTIHMIDTIVKQIDRSYNAQSDRARILVGIFEDNRLNQFVNQHIGQLIYHSVMYSEHSVFIIRILLEQYDNTNSDAKVETENHIQLANLQMAYDYARNTNNHEVVHFLDSNPIDSSILALT
jgi:hypothetical protein